ncbi:MAG: radical SAM protein [Deltaproteobacteria bacterium]|nr:radical SAM protein [Deltaproteobacteria bacterium]
MSWPAYLDTWRSGELARRARESIASLASCTVCPRDCRIDRLRDEKKVCHVGRLARVGSWFPHLGEEDCLRGWAGSGTIFFSWCNLKCVFCQNWETSNEGAGEEVSAQRLAAIMLELQSQGCHNVNLVTPEHVVPQILEALPLAIEDGLRLPIVYNTSAYDSLESLRLLDGVVDIYMPDLKYFDPRASASLLKAKDYPEHARAAIREMHRQVGPLQLDDEGLARRGLLVRHLVMPGSVDDSERIFRWLATEISPETYVNVMDQYHPDGLVAREPDRYPTLARPLRHQEWLDALERARAAGLHRLDERRPHPRLRSRMRRLAVF